LACLPAKRRRQGSLFPNSILLAVILGFGWPTALNRKLAVHTTTSPQGWWLQPGGGQPQKQQQQTQQHTTTTTQQKNGITQPTKQTTTQTNTQQTNNNKHTDICFPLKPRESQPEHWT
jgi:hypothetical protein